MEPEAPRAELFVARDRARRFSRYIRAALQERRLHYRGAAVGMESLTSEADEALAAVVADVEGTVGDVLEGRLRDRERGYMEMPLVTAAEAVAERVGIARRLDSHQAAGGDGARAVRAAVLHLLDESLQRLEAYCGAYDAKRPAGLPRAADLAHLLAEVERTNAWRTAASPPTGPAADRTLAPIRSDPHVLDDVLRAARAAVASAPGPWRVEPAGPGRPLRLSLGSASAGAVALDVPARLARALQVLSFLHPSGVTCQGVPGGPAGGLLSTDAGPSADRVEVVSLELADEAAGGVELSLAAAAGGDAKLHPDDEAAVRALVQAPPLAERGPPPPQRLVALMGLLRALDAALARTLASRASTNACRVAASRMPREATRKAPLARRFVADLAAAFPDLPVHRLEAVAADAAAARITARHARAADAAALLALLGRGPPARRALALDPLDARDVDALIEGLCAVAAVRRDLERAADVEPARITRLEQASVAALGRLGRLGRL